MNRSEQLRLNRLLSKGAELSVQEKEEMLVHLIGPEPVPEGERRGSGRRSLLIWVAGAATAATIAIVLGLTQQPGIENRQDAFTVRGGDTGGSFRIECVTPSGETGTCATGDTIVFGIRPPKAAAYFSSASLDTNGNLVRYFPSETQKSVPISKIGVLDKGIEIGSEHLPGRYRVFGIFSESSLSAKELKMTVEAHAMGRVSSVAGIISVRDGWLEVVAK